MARGFNRGALGIAVVGVGMLLIPTTSAAALGLETTSSFASIGLGATASPGEEDPVLITVPFEHSVSLQEAIAATERTTYDVVGFRYDNPGIVGEYYLGSGIAPDEYLKDFTAQYGSAPQVVAAITEQPKDAVSKGTKGQKQSAVTLPVEVPEFVAPPIGGPAVESLDTFISEQSTEQMAITASSYVAVRDSWKPSEVSVMIQNQGSSNYFEQFAYWPGPSSPANVPYHVGVEIEVNLYNSASTAGRPACAIGYKDAFFAKNYGWNWAVWNSNYAPLTGVGAYADYNDLSDPCNRNSIAVGMRYPKNIPTSPNNSGYAIGVSITAPKGNQASNRIGAVWQLVDDTYCSNSSDNGLTDCMGLGGLQLPSGMDGARGVLAESRNWTAPDRCWTSGDYGYGTPAGLPGSSNGC